VIYLFDPYYRRTWIYPATVFAHAVAYFLAAGFVWRNASSLAGDDSVPSQSEILTSAAAVRIMLIGIATFIGFEHLSEVINFGWQYFESPSETARGYGRGFTIGGVVTFFVALITIIVVVKGQAIRRFFSFVPDEPYEEFKE
jgi:hypothetical protein